MKNKILLCAMMLVACTVSLNVSAQLEVQTSGDVVISKCWKKNAVLIPVHKHNHNHSGSVAVLVKCSCKHGTFLVTRAKKELLTRFASY